MQVEVGIVHGRFQPLHIGHMEYLLAAYARCDLLVVGITNSDPSQVRSETTNPQRSSVQANPCTYYERYAMVEGALRDSGLPDSTFRIVPFPINRPEYIQHYVPAHGVHFITIYDDWGESKLERLQRQNLEVEVLWRRTSKIITGTELRKRISSDGDWHRWVPNAVAETIQKYDIAIRIAKKFAADPV